MEKRQITNEELYEYLYSIEPTDEVQRKLINKLMGIVYMGMTDNVPESVTEFINNSDEVEGKTSQKIYNFYVEFCEANGYTAVDCRAFGRYIKKLCNVKTEVEIINGKSMRVYRFKEVY